MSVGKAIRILRLRHKIPQQKLAKNIGVTQGYLSLIEKGLREPGFSLISKVAKSLGIPIQLIFLFAYRDNKGNRRFAKPLKKILALTDDILKAM